MYKHWLCEHPVTRDVKAAAILDHKEKLEADGYVCVLYNDKEAIITEEADGPDKA